MLATVVAPASGNLFFTNHRQRHCPDRHSWNCSFNNDGAMKTVNALRALNTSLRKSLTRVITRGWRRVLIICLRHVHRFVNFLLPVDGKV